MLPTFIIGLREGLEASLIIGIIAAFLIQRGERRALRPMWYGVGLAVALCLGVARDLGGRRPGAALTSNRRGSKRSWPWSPSSGVTYMVVWMKRHSRELKGSLERSAESALVLGSAWALIGMAFFAVLREGLETAVFLLAVFGNSTNPAATGTGAVLGIAVAVGLGFAIYKEACGSTSVAVLPVHRFRAGARRRRPAGDRRPHRARGRLDRPSSRPRHSTSAGWSRPGPSGPRC